MADKNTIYMSEKQKVKEITDKPEATLVAGYQAWQKNFERHVNKGEKAIRILAPAPYKIKEERDKLDPVPIAFEDIPGDSKGYFSTTEKRIAVQENMSESQTLKTMVHEVAHSMLHDKEVNQNMDIPAKDRNTKEAEAESVAFTVCQHFEIWAFFFPQNGISDKVLLQERFFNARKPMEFLFLSERKVGCEKYGKIDI